MWVVLLPNDALTVTILPESLYEALVILPPYIFLPLHGSSSIEMVNVDPADLAAAQERDQMPSSAKMG
jgi:hypothetical protein